MQLEALMAIDDAEELERMLRQVVERADPLAVYLFGSRARGDANVDSDYDLMIVVDDGVPDDKIGVRAGFALIKDRKIPMDAIVLRSRTFNERRHVPGTLSYEVEIEGVRLYPCGGDSRHRIDSTSRLSPVSVETVVREWVDRAVWHLPIIPRCMADVPERCAFHLQQAALKLTKAALVAHRIRPAKGEQVGLLAEQLSDEFPLRPRLLSLDPLSPYSWAYQEPVEPGTVLPPEPTAEAVARWYEEIQAIREDFERWLEQRAAEGG